MDDNSKGIPINNKNTLYFPNYHEYELNRLAPTVQLSMAIGAILLLGFGVLDSADNPELTYKIIVIRLCSALPLFTIFLLSKFKNTLALMKKSIMFLGLLSFSSYTYLHTQIHEKIYYIAIAWLTHSDNESLMRISKIEKCV